MSVVNTAGINPLQNEIQNTQTTTENYDTSHVICNSDGTIDIKGQVIFNPPIPIGDPSLIQSPDLSSQLQCINGGEITVLGTIQGYSTTSETNQNLNQAIGALSGEYVAISTPLDQITQPTATLQMNNQQIDGLADPTDVQMAVNVNFLTTNYYDTAQSDQNITNALDSLQTVYMDINDSLADIATNNPATSSIDMNNQLVSNVLDPVSAQDTVTKNYLVNNYTNTTNSQSYVNNAISGLTLNSLGAQTANYDTSGYQITVSNAPTIGNDLSNKTYVDGQISTRYANTTSLNNIVVPTGSVNFNSQKAINLLNPTNAQDGVTLGYIQTFYVTLSYLAANFFTSGYIIANYLTQTSAAATYATISSLSSYVTNSALTSTLANYTLLQTFNDTVATLITSSYLTTNYYTATYINSTFQTIANMSQYYTKTVSDSTFATISSLSSYVLQSSLTTQLSDYLTIVSASSTYQTIAGMSSYLTSAIAESTYQTLAGMTNYITSTQLATSLTAYVQTSALASYLTQIQSTSTAKSKVNCSSASQIVLTVNDVDKGYFYTPTGQATTPLGLLATDKLQFQSNLNSFSFYGGKTLQNTPTQNYNSVYINSSDDITKNVGFQLSLGGTSALTQECVLSTGHTLLGGNQVPYSALSNNSTSPQYNMQISGGTPQTDQTLTLYSDYYAGILGYNLTAQFNKKAGYSATTSITEPNQFPSKTWVDSSISGLSSIYLSIANAASTYLSISTFNSTIANYYTKTLSDARYYLNTVTLNNITAPTGNLAMANNRITGMADGINPNDAATVQQIVSGGGLTKTQADTYYQAITTTLNNIPLAQGNVSINTQKITDLVAGTNNTDAVNLLQMTNAIAARTPFKSVQIVVGATNTSSSGVNVSSFTSTGSFVTSVTKQAQDPLLCAQQIVINYPNQTTVPTVFISVQQSGSAAPGAYGSIYNVYSTTTTQCSICVRFPGSGGAPSNSPGSFPNGVTLNCLFINPTPYPV